MKKRSERIQKTINMKWFGYVLLVSALSFVLWAQSGYKITIIGDSTVCNYSSSKYPQTGWGQVIGNFFKSGSVTINNRAIGGRSTRSFYQEGRWAEIVPTLETGEYVFIQFGHNDRDWSKEERYTDTTQYKEYLRLYVEESRAKGAIPVLISPMNMNAWNGATVREVFCEGENNYRGAMMNVAQELQVPFIDLEKKSVALQSRVGSSYAAQFIHLGLSPGEYENFPEGVSDGTHFQEMGALFMAKFVCDGISELQNDPDLSRLSSVLKPLFNVNVLSNKENAGMITESANAFPDNISITLKVKPNTGENFLGWINESGEKVTTSTRFIFLMPDSDVTYTALFEGGTKLYSLNTSVGSGEGVILPENGKYSANTEITITANAQNGYLFDHWEGDLLGDENPATITMDSDKSISAFFIPDNTTYYSVKAISMGNGTVTMNPADTILAEKTEVHITAYPSTGWFFDRWTGDFTGTDSTLVISSLDKNYSLIARFMPVNINVYEAEYAVMKSAIAESTNTGFSGTGYANVDNKTGSSIEIPVYISENGEKEVKITYANGSTSARTFIIGVNETEIVSKSFAVTGNWTNWDTLTVILPFNEGINTVIFTSSEEEGGPNIDKIEILQSAGKSSIKPLSNHSALELFYRDNKLVIKTENQSLSLVEIYSLKGQKIFSKKIQNEKKKLTSVIPVEFLCNGIYVAKTFSGTQSPGYLIFAKH